VKFDLEGLLVVPQMAVLQPGQPHHAFLIKSVEFVRVDHPIGVHQRLQKPLNMEVASPLAFSPAPSGAKRGLSCSPDLMDASVRNLAENMEVSEDVHRAKRRRFAGDFSVDNLSERLSSHSPFFSGGLAGSKNIFGNNNNGKFALS
jgi:hypothetical protein